MMLSEMDQLTMGEQWEQSRVNNQWHNLLEYNTTSNVEIEHSKSFF